jgi:hypothetical protein
MKIFNKHIAIVALSAFSFTACIKDFQEVNTNKLQPTDADINRGGYSSGGYFNELVQRPIPTGVGVGPANDYQVVQNMSTDNWVGYFSPGRNSWDNGFNQTSYYISNGRANGTFSTLITRVMNPYFQIKGQMHNVETVNGKLVYQPKDLTSNAIYQLAQIVKIMGMHRATDLFGPIPYSDMEPGKVKAKYDSQEKVYRSFLKELEEAVAVLNQYGANNKVLQDFDPVYSGDTSKWIRLANSLMLRLAMRVRYADAALSQEYVTKAINGGLIENDDQAGKLVTSSKYIFHHSLVTMLGYGELKMGATIYSYLKGYDDPRMAKYFTKSTPYGQPLDFYAVRSGLNNTTQAADYKDYSVPTVVQTTPTYWLRASEVQFLLAEAALINWYNGDTAENLYKKGIEMSFTENGLTTAQAQAYYNASGVPVKYVDPRDSNYNVDAKSTINKKWSTVTSAEEHLEQIITQKYLANYPNGFESWSEWKRTGYPRMFTAAYNLSNVGAQNIDVTGKDFGVRRFPFPQSEFELNAENVTAAKSLLGGPDNAATNVWWDKKSK